MSKTMGKRNLTKNALRATAYHEAGHAVAAFDLGVKLGKISIIADAESAGRTFHRNLLAKLQLDIDQSDRVRMKAEKDVLICLAGQAAQRRFNSRSVRKHHAYSDYRRAVQVLSYFANSRRALNAYMNLLQI